MRSCEEKEAPPLSSTTPWCRPDNVQPPSSIEHLSVSYGKATSPENLQSTSRVPVRA